LDGIKEKKVSLPNDLVLNIFGLHDENLIEIEKNFPVKIVARGTEITISGSKENLQQVELLFEKLVHLAGNSNQINKQDVIYAIEAIKNNQGELLDELYQEIIETKRGKKIKAKTFGQKRYIEMIRNNCIVFAIGPAGTGKTYLAIAMAVKAFQEKEISKIILTRPAVEAGEKLGFLPGDLQEKVDPYLRPLYDGLIDILGSEMFNKLLERGMIEVAPLAYMRGRTLDDSFIILDEAQNTTREQMKMFLTRMGFGSKVVVTGDITQIDLPRGQFSGLIEVGNILKDIKGIGFAYLTSNDVVRHSLVQKIIDAYENANAHSNCFHE
jgi:phosphate starvation-inducible PhoH-like protein